MAVNKVVYGTTVLVDLTGDTVTQEALVSGYTAHDRSGALIVGTAILNDDSAYTRTVVFSQQTLTPDSSRRATLPNMPELVVGKHYIVTMDGVEYFTTCSSVWEDNHLIGDYNNIWSPNADAIYPFVAATVSESREIYFYNGNPHTVKIEQLELIDDPINIIPKTINANGTYTASADNADGYSSVTVNVPSGGASMNVQVAQSTTRVASTTYTKTATLTCSKAGTYDVYWDCFRSSTSGTSGSQLYVGGSEYGNPNTTFSSNIHVQSNHLTGVTLAANQEVAVYVRSRASNYYAYCGQLTIVQTA